MSSTGMTRGTVSNQGSGLSRHRGRIILGLAAASVLGSAGHTLALDIVKTNNSTILSTSTSWVGSVAPGSSDYAVWNTASGATNTSLSVALGANVSWFGIKIQSTALGVSINDTASTTLSLGAGGIDMTVASQNLIIKSPISLTAATSITFAGASARQITLWNADGTRGLTGTTNVTLARLAGSATHTLLMQPGFAGSVGFNDTGANTAFSGNWTVGTGTKILTERNGATAWGTGTINLAGGTISQTLGSWDWNNKIAVGTAGGTIGSETTGTNNFLVLSGVISGASTTLNFTGAAGTLGEGIILTGINTYTGAMQINSGAIVRIGGAGNTTTNSSAGGTNGSISASVAITNNGALNFGRTDGQTIANFITGTGNSTVITGASVNLTGTTNSYTGVNTLVGAMSAVKIANGGSVSSIGSSTAAASNLVFNGGTLSYTGSGDITDRNFTMAGSATLQNNGAGSLTFTNTGTIAQSGTASARTLTLGGTSTANNIFGLVVSDSGTGANITSLNKIGAGKWILTSSLVNTGGTTITTGTLQVGNGGAGGALGSGSITNNATLSVNRSDAFTMAQPMSGTGSFIHLGAGTTTLTGSSSYNGSTFVSGGTLLVNGANASKITVAGSAVLGGTGTIAPASGTAITVNGDGLLVPGSSSNTGTLTAGSVTFAANSGLQYTWNGAGFAKLNSTGTLDVSDTGVTINVIGTPTGSPGATYDLIDYNVITGTTSASNFTITQTDPRAIFSMTEDTTNGIYQLVYGGQDYPLWQGNINSTWDTATQNWQLMANATATTYVEGDNTLFDDSAVNYTVTLASSVTPNSVTVDNSLTNYLFQGAGKIVGATGITKTGTSMLTLANTGTNTFTGLTDIQAGTLKVGAVGALSAASTVAITGGATLDLGGFTSAIPGLTGAGIVSNSSVTASTLSLNIAGTNTFAGNIQNGTGSVAVTKTGAGQLVLSGTDTYSGLTDVQVGSLKAGSASAISANSTVNLAAATSLDLNGFSSTIPGLSGTGTVTNSSGSSVTLTVNTAGTTTFSGAIANGTGGVGFTKSGAGTFTLAGSDSYTGLTSVTGGTLKLGNANAISTASTVSLSAATLDVAGLSPSVAALTGTGTVTSSSATASSVTTNSSGPYSFAGSIQDGAGTLSLNKNGTGTMTLTGSNAYTGGTTITNGVLVDGSANAIPSNSLTIQAPGTLDLNGFSPTLNLISGSGLVTNNNATTGTLVLADTSNQTFAGRLADGAGKVALTKSGSNTVTLSGSSTNTGATSVSNGVLNITGTYAPTSTVTSNTLAVASGAGVVVGGSASFFTASSPSSDVTVNGTLNIKSNSTSDVSTVQLLKGTGNVAIDKGTLNTPAGVRTGGLALTGGAVIAIGTTDADGAGAGVQGSIAGVSKVTSLSIDATSKLDLKNNGLIIPAAGSLNGSAITVDTLRAALIAGRGGAGTGAATWSGPGGIGTSTFTFDETFDSIGYCWTGDPNLLVGPTDVNGESYDAGDYVVKYCAGADADLNGLVDDTDVAVIGLTYDSGASTGHHWYEGDFNYDGLINDDDVAIIGLAYSPANAPLSPSFYAALSAEYGSSFASAFAAGAAGTVVPEPASLSLIAVGAMGLIRRRRR